MANTHYMQKVLNIGVGAEVMEQIELLCSIKQMSKAKLIRTLVTEYVERNKATIEAYQKAKAAADKALASME